MPEGPEVRSITDKLSERITGMVLTGLSWDQSSKYSEGLPRYDQLRSILPMTVAGVTCKGKQIFFHLAKEYLIDGRPYTHRVYLNSTLGMEGKWSWSPGNHSNFWLTLGTRRETVPRLAKESRRDSTELSRSDDRRSPEFNTDLRPVDLIVVGQTVYFDDSRHFGNLTLMSEQDYREKLGKIGPDLLAEDISLEQWTREFRSSRRSGMQICDFLMKQEYFSGIGNYLKAEILYRSKIRPDRTLWEIHDDEMVTILQQSMATIRESYSYKGLTVRSYWDPDGEKGTFPRQIYEKEIDPLGHRVIKSQFKDGRTTHWVPEVQK